MGIEQHPQSLHDDFLRDWLPGAEFPHVRPKVNELDSLILHPVEAAAQAAASVLCEHNAGC